MRIPGPRAGPPVRRRATLISAAAVAAVLVWGPAAAGPKVAYVQPVWFQWETSVLDVVVVPPGHGQLANDFGVLGGFDRRELSPYENSYLRAILRSVRAWQRAAHDMGSDRLRGALRIRTHVLGRDGVPPDVLAGAEVVIVTDETKAFVLGLAVEGRPCIVDNSMMFTSSFTYADMYNVNGQEFGHCLGLGHSFRIPHGRGVIGHDVMFATYGHAPGRVTTHRHCVSNLNVAGLELVFGSTLASEPGMTAEIAPRRYRRAPC